MWDVPPIRFGAYQLIIDLLRSLFPQGDDQLPRLFDLSAQTWTLNALSNSYSLSGQPRRAIPLLEKHNAICKMANHMDNLAIGLGNVAGNQLRTGALQAAEANLCESIALCRKLKTQGTEAIGRAELGRLLAYRGAYAKSKTELATALRLFDKKNQMQSKGIVWAHRALRKLLQPREVSQSATRNPKSAINPARKALELADENARINYSVERDIIHAQWLLGAAYRMASQYDIAQRYLLEALERCRRINLVEYESDILIELARLRVAISAPEEAQRLADEALTITERSGYVLQGADAHLELATLALTRGDKATALEHAKEARRLATCDGPPDYTYKVAYDEAGVLLEKLKKS